MIGAGSDLPARPDASVAVRPGRRWLPPFVVLLVMSVTVLGGYVTAAALPEPQVRSLTVGGAVKVRPLPGWAVVRRERVGLPSPSGGVLEVSFAQLSRGSGALDVVAIPRLGGTVEDLAVLYRDEVLASQLQRLSVSNELLRITLPSGLQGARFAYIGSEHDSGAAIEGSVTVVVASSGNAAVFDGWGPEGQLRLIADELDAMIQTAEVT